MTFGEKFKAEREKKNLTQQQVADGLGIVLAVLLDMVIPFHFG